MLADYHVHTAFSDDSTEPIENVVREAINNGLTEICFTDHVDYGIKYDVAELAALRGSERVLTNVNYPEYFRRIAELQVAYAGQISLKAGLELGVQVHTIPRYRALFDSHELDFAILSCHQAEDKEFWTYAFQKGRTQQEYNERYYQEILDCIRQYKGYSVLGHLDMIQRHNDPIYPFEKSRDIIEAILCQAIRDGKGIEVNTSSFLYKLPDLTPERKILRLYRELGGEILTVGSDCHTASRVGEHIAHMYGELKSMGYRAVCTFNKMQPVFHTL